MKRIRWKRLCLLLALAVLLSAANWHLCRPVLAEVFSPAGMEGVTVVIDAGHGGVDGGAVSSKGTVESGINLDIALKLDDLLHLYGVSTVMVRREDVSLHDDSAATIREKKRSDLQNRVKLVNETKNGVLLSIHQNIFSNAGQAGPQVFYADAETSLIWAKQTQAMLQTVTGGKARRAARISDSVYLMKHITKPAILVECGFLSNPREEANLQNDAYQTKLAAALAVSAMRHFKTPRGGPGAITEGGPG